MLLIYIINYASYIIVIEHLKNIILNDIKRFIIKTYDELPDLSHVVSSRLIRVADSDPIRRAGVPLDIRAANIFGAIAKLRDVFGYHDDKGQSITREAKVVIFTW